jgi:uncharacterized membrane protein (UPF0127 family)
MTTRWIILGIAVLSVLGVGIGISRPSQPSSVSLEREAPTTDESEGADFGGVSLRLDYATTTEEHARGLGGRANIPLDYGMLFVFPRDDRYGFWMKDTLVSLDIFWLNDKGQVVSIAERVAPSSYPTVFYPSVPARYVLETAAGFADTYHIATGTLLRLKDLPDVSQ